MISKELVRLVNEKQRILRDLEAKAFESGNIDAKREMAVKRRVLNRVLASRESINDVPCVFMSFSKGTGGSLAQKAKEEFQQWGIEVRTGFDEDVQVKDDIKAIIERIKSCNLFLGIWTPQYKLREDTFQSEEKTIPSIWLLEEKGMAEALGIPIRLLIHSSIHRDFYDLTSQGKLKSIFDQSNFETKLGEAIKALQLRYNEKFG